jgi:triphosphoribosyl-dephospho-CoA synthetase
MPRWVADHVSSVAAAALLAELETWPKPGLVSHVDSGSHADMDASMLKASATAIAPFYDQLAVAGAAGSGMNRLREIGVEAERAMLAATEAARVQSFFAILASIEDTNLLYRGGGAGLRYAQEAAVDFLGQGGVQQADWREEAATAHHAFVARHLSPGGCADLLAITLFLDALEAHS